MRLAPLLMLVLVLGCLKRPVQQPDVNQTVVVAPETPSTPQASETPSCSDGVWNQGEAGIDCGGPCETACIGQPAVPEPVPTKVKSASLLSAFGLRMDGDPFSKSWSSIYSYYFQPGCSADLYVTNEPCAERTNEGSGYTNKTWCSGGKTYTLSSRCLSQSVTSIQSSIWSDQLNLTKDILIYLPSKIVGVTLRIDESYDWGDASFVYTNHGEYLPQAKSVSVSGKQAFCADPSCNRMFVMVDHPAKYVSVSGSDPERTRQAMTRFIGDNLEHVYEPRLSSLSFLSNAYAFNRAVKVCAYPYGLMRAEKTKVDWPSGTLLTDLEFTRIYWPFAFYYDPSVLSKPDTIGTQFNLMTGEFSYVKKLSDPGKYQLCASEQMMTCSEACSADDVLALGSCSSSGMVPFQSELPGMISMFKRFYTHANFKDAMCFYLFDNQGEQDLLQAGATGNGFVFMKLDKASPTVNLMAFKGVVDTSMLESILKRRYGITRISFNRVAIDRDCMEYEYDNGYVANCDVGGISYVAFNTCDRKDDCRAAIDAAVQTIQSQMI